MAQECGFFNAQLVGEEYDRVYLAEQFAAYFASFIGNGVFGSSMQQLEVTANNDMTTNVLSGQAWINGWWYRNTDVYTLSHSVADGILSRIDIVVLRWDHSARDMYLAVIEGTPSANPIKPPIVRNANYYDLQLCEVSIPAGSIRITQAQITDTRLDNAVCGLVTGVVDQIDTTTLFNQFETYFEEFKKFYENDYVNWTTEQKQAYITWVALQEKDYIDWTTEQKAEYDAWYATHIDLWQNEFTTWFDNIKGQLSEDAAGKIQIELDEHEARLSNLENMIISGKAFAPAEISSGELLATSNNEVILFEWSIGCRC